LNDQPSQQESDGALHSFGGKVALVTGASSGVGRAVARLLAGRGAAVVCCDLQQAPVEGGFDRDSSLTTVEAITGDGGQAAFAQTDVSTAGDVAHAVHIAVERFGRLDVQINNAGIWPGFATALEESEEALDRILAVNLKGAYFGCKYAVRQMRAQNAGGRIVNVASIAGLVGLEREPAYTASKAALIGLTRQLAVDFGPQGIAVNAVCPGFLATALSRETLGANPEHDQTPWPRIGTVDDAAQGIAFLASDAAGFINGAVLTVDGGYTAR
jgi:NAD(P)-dependent dehydrogenase (short-subunit alcohol dehydrogenase family)